MEARGPVFSPEMQYLGTNWKGFFTEMKNSTPDRSYDLLSAIVWRILLISLISLHIPFINGGSEKTTVCGKSRK